MNLLTYTKLHNGTDKPDCTGAALLSMLPYGCAYRLDLMKCFTKSNATEGVKRLIKGGLAVEYYHTRRTPKRQYKLPYLILTGKGLVYLAERYGDDYPWLGRAIEHFISRDNAVVRASHADRTIHLILSFQSCNLFFSRVGCQTIIERMRREPAKALCAIQIALNSAPLQNTLLMSISKAIKEWLASLNGCGVENREPREELSQWKYYDSLELKAPEDNPYINPDFAFPDELISRTDDKVVYISPYKGVLCFEDNYFVVFLNRREGIQWSKLSMQLSKPVINRQLCRIGAIKNSWEAPTALKGMVLSNDIGQGIPAFAHMCRDPFNIRKSKNSSELGLGTPALTLIPNVPDAIGFVRVLLSFTATKTSFVRSFRDSIIDRWPGCFQKAETGSVAPLLYEGTPCVFALGLEAGVLNHCISMEEARLVLLEKGGAPDVIRKYDFVLVCLDWQVPYLRAVFPYDTVIVGVSQTGDELTEYVPTEPRPPKKPKKKRGRKRKKPEPDVGTSPRETD